MKKIRNFRNLYYLCRNGCNQCRSYSRPIFRGYQLCHVKDKCCGIRTRKSNRVKRACALN